MLSIGLILYTVSTQQGNRHLTHFEGSDLTYFLAFQPKTTSPQEILQLSGASLACSEPLIQTPKTYSSFLIGLESMEGRL